MQLVLASNNLHKLGELRTLLAPLGVELVSQSTLGIGEADEPHVTFIENALAKARHAAQHSGFAAIADDSGICVDALGGAPGVQSAQYADHADYASHASHADHAGSARPVFPHDADRETRRQLQDAANNAKLVERLQDVAEAGRGARYVCTLVALRSADDPEPLVAVGRWAGRILAPAGTNGFGYDPLMFIPAFGCSVAELPAEVKNEHSHRARAAAEMCALLRGVWRLG